MISPWFSQFYPPKPTFTEANVPSQKGRVFVVTGGSNGLGFLLCKILYNTGATVYMTSRSEKRSLDAIAAIKSAVPEATNPGILKQIPLDQADLESVRAFAKAFAVAETRLDILWNNAGQGALGIPPGTKTAQGLEYFVGIHCVAGQLLTELLLPQLRAAPEPRVVWTSSGVAFLDSPPNGMDFAVLDAGGTGGRQVDYGYSKSGAWMLAHEFARRNPGIVSVVQNPGNLKGTKGFDGVWGPVKFAMEIIMLHKPINGAYTELFAGLSPDVGKNGNFDFVIPFGRVMTEKMNPRPDIAKALKTKEEGGEDIGRRFWEWCEKKWELSK